MLYILLWYSNIVKHAWLWKEQSGMRVGESILPFSVIYWLHDLGQEASVPFGFFNYRAVEELSVRSVERAWLRVRQTWVRILALGTSLVARWLRIRLPMQGTRVWSLVREDPTCHGATKPVRHNYWACVTQLLKPACLEPVLCNKRSHRNEKPMHRNEE